MPAVSSPDRLPVTPAGLVVVLDGARFVVATRRGDCWYVAERTPHGLVARWRCRRRRAAVERRAELVRAG